MKTQDQNLLKIIEDLKNRNNKARFEQSLKANDREYKRGLLNMGVTIINEVTQ